MSTDLREAEAPDVRDDHRFLGHPWPLANLFGVELWERFSFYGMQGILTIYLYYSATAGGLGLSEATAASIVGAYGGSVYFATILGGWVADRVLGPERTLFASAAVVMLGHVALSLLPGFTGVGVGLGLIALGSGGVKANATSLVGSLYAADDTRRDGGFSLFYLGINLGAFTGPLLTGLLQDDIGFRYGFGAAAVGMALGLVQYSIGRRSLPADTHDVVNPVSRVHGLTYLAGVVLAALVVLALVLVGAMTAANLATWVIVLTAVASVVFFAVVLRSHEITTDERSRVLSFVPLFAVNVVFWSLYQQQFTVVEIFADKRLDRDLFGWQMPVSWVNSINPVFVIVLAGAFAALWTRLGPRQPATPVKFGAAVVVMGLAFWTFIPNPDGSGSAPLWLLVVTLLAFTLAELLISPVGLSLSTKLAPERFHTQMVALYFLSVALGTALAGKLAGYYSASHETAYFGVLGLVAILTGAACLAARGPIGRLVAGVH